MKSNQQQLVYNKKMSSQLTTESYWCFDCQLQSSSLSSDYTCLKCKSAAVEEITLENDPRNHEVPTVHPAHPNTDENPNIGVVARIIRIGDGEITITIINTGDDDHEHGADDQRGGRRGFNLLRFLGTLFADEGDETPATQQQIENLERTETIECSVCQQNDNEGHGLKLQCGHTYHKDCILPWFQLNNTCPTCRTQLPQQ